jgi:anti-repressor protein
MEELVKISKSAGGKDIVSARELYQFLEVTERFSNWIERQFQYGFSERVDYVGCKVFNTLANQELDDYALTIDCAKEISMLQRSEKGKQARLYFIECEKRLRSNLIQLPDFNNPAIAARAWAEQFEAKQLAESKIKELTPKAEVYDQISDSSNLKTIKQVAKELGTGEHRLFSWLREQHILMKGNIPYQKFIEQGYFEVKAKIIPSLTQNYSQTFITGKGEIWLTRIYKKCHNVFS